MTNTTPLARLREGLSAPEPTSGLVAFRVLFGAVAAFSALRFEWNGWVEAFFGRPRFFFHFYGFEWVQPLSLPAMHGLFAVMAVAGIGIALGALYRLATLVYFLAFTYVELCDVSNYLNHYYLQSLLAFVLCFLPLHRSRSVDARVFPSLRVDAFPRWMTWLLRGQLAIVYFYAAVAKATPDWLIHGQPMQIWLRARTDAALIGPLFDLPHVPLAMGWMGFLYDLTIPLFLLHPRTRLPAYAVVVAFHTLTKLLFPIGMFPVIMTTSTLVFFATDWPEQVLRFVRRQAGPAGVWVPLAPFRSPAWPVALAAGWLVFHALWPLRTFAYGGNVLWHEQGMRFSWRVLAREKNGSVTFRVRLPGEARDLRVQPRRYLTSIQEREMAVQPDLILQLAHRIAEDYRRQGHADVEVRVDALCSLNGRPMAHLIDPEVDLAAVQPSWAPAAWILPAPDGPPPAVHRPSSLASLR